MASASNEDSQAQRQDPEEDVVDPRPQCWKDLRAKTGFTSYIDYVKAYKDRDRQSLFNLLFDLEQDLDAKIRECSEGPLGRSRCLIELSKGADLAVNIRQRSFGAFGTEVLEAMQHPPKDVYVQVFIWQMRYANEISPPLVDAFGLGLGISPQFFKALFLVIKGQPVQEDLRRLETELRPLRSDFVVIGNTVITISRYQHNETNSVPVVLIAGKISLAMRDLTVLDCVDQELRETPVLKRPLGECRSCHIVGTSTRPVGRYKVIQRYVGQTQGAARLCGHVSCTFRGDSWVFSYLELLNELLRRNDIREMSEDTLSFVVLIPVMLLEILRIRQSCRLLRLILPVAGSDAHVDIARIHADRRSLRRSMEDLEDFLDHLSMHCSWPSVKEWLQESIYRDAEQQMRQCCLQARRLEAEARDSLQLEAGFLALQESKKSIELSNHQIQEGKRVKIFTILAFIYVPLNLATSIFGMNLQELNHNGQQFSVLMATAVTAMLITLGSWVCFEQVNGYRTWNGMVQEKRPKHSSREDDDHPPGKRYALAARVAMLVWLLKSGHKSWMQTSGAWWRILLNDRTGASSWGLQTTLPESLKCEVLGMTAGDYVSEFSAAQSLEFDPFDPKSKPWEKQVIYIWTETVNGSHLREERPPPDISRIFRWFFTIRSLRSAWPRWWRRHE